MSSTINVELDTTPPQVAIIAPIYTVPGTETALIVKADEQLDLNHEAYIIDAAGTRHDLVLEYRGNALYGEINVTGYAIGIATIFARVRDDVHNQSGTALATMDIKRAARVFLIIEVQSREPDVGLGYRPLNTNMAQRVPHTNRMSRDTIIDTAFREISMGAETI